ncbi:hypothetical protein Nans01_44280 [Nocardiopsis ansamitocini]|uniref:Uncharacterized protein n=1 Tax=Nocardiopsis ansamitocini TaxID=1670832 RepID=A0A9W6PAQ6_9ACTN|nr:hypothetical protein Nans01_44280 [Nocardiopsis ansamitocini]
MCLRHNGGRSASAGLWRRRWERGTGAGRARPGRTAERACPVVATINIGPGTVSNPLLSWKVSVGPVRPGPLLLPVSLQTNGACVAGGAEGVESPAGRSGVPISEWPKIAFSG